MGFRDAVAIGTAATGTLLERWGPNSGLTEDGHTSRSALEQADAEFTSRLS